MISGAFLLSRFPSINQHPAVSEDFRVLDARYVEAAPLHPDILQAKQSCWETVPMTTPKKVRMILAVEPEAKEWLRERAYRLRSNLTREINAAIKEKMDRERGERAAEQA